MFYEQVKALCDSRNLAVTTLARKLNLSPTSPGNWKEGSYPKVETIMKIADYFGVSTDYLLYGQDRCSNQATAQQGANVLQGNISGSRISATNGQESSRDAFEAELIRIYKALDMKSKTDLIQYAYSLESPQSVPKDGDAIE